MYIRSFYELEEKLYVSSRLENSFHLLFQSLRDQYFSLVKLITNLNINNKNTKIIDSFSNK